MNVRRTALGLSDDVKSKIENLKIKKDEIIVPAGVVANWVDEYYKTRAVEQPHNEEHASSTRTVIENEGPSRIITSESSVAPERRRRKVRFVSPLSSPDHATLDDSEADSQSNDALNQLETEPIDVANYTPESLVDVERSATNDIPATPPSPDDSTAGGGESGDDVDPRTALWDAEHDPQHLNLDDRTLHALDEDLEPGTFMDRLEATPDLASERDAPNIVPTSIAPHNDNVNAGRRGISLALRNAKHFVPVADLTASPPDYDDEELPTSRDEFDDVAIEPESPVDVGATPTNDIPTTPPISNDGAGELDPRTALWDADLDSPPPSQDLSPLTLDNRTLHALDEDHISDSHSIDEVRSSDDEPEARPSDVADLEEREGNAPNVIPTSTTITPPNTLNAGRRGTSSTQLNAKHFVLPSELTASPPDYDDDEELPTSQDDFDHDQEDSGQAESSSSSTADIAQEENKREEDEARSESSRSFNIVPERPLARDLDEARERLKTSVTRSASKSAVPKTKAPEPAKKRSSTSAILPSLFFLPSASQNSDEEEEEEEK